MPPLHVSVGQGCSHRVVVVLEVARGAAVAGRGVQWASMLPWAQQQGSRRAPCWPSCRASCWGCFLRATLWHPHRSTTR